MPILSASQLEQARTQYKRLLHNMTTSVLKITETTVVQPDPRFQSRSTKTLAQWDDFVCSMFHFISGKTDRLLQERGETSLIAQLGLSPETAIVIQYVNGILLTVPHDPEQPITEIDNTLIEGEQILYRGEWWTIRVDIPDSEGIQHTAFATK
jgi:hypothetical protein